MPLVRGGRPLKRWTYVGAYGPGADAVRRAARAIGVDPDRLVGGMGPRRSRLMQRTTRADGARPRRRCRPLDLEVRTTDGDRGRLPARRQYAWTRKRAARVRVGRRPAIELRGDRRRVGRLPRAPHRRGGGRPASARWPPASRSPGTWSTGSTTRPRRPSAPSGSPASRARSPPVEFADDLSRVGGLRFTPEAVARARENLVLLRSDYEQPFGTFTGELPGGRAAGARAGA